MGIVYYKDKHCKHWIIKCSFYGNYTIFDKDDSGHYFKSRNDARIYSLSSNKVKDLFNTQFYIDKKNFLFSMHLEQKESTYYSTIYTFNKYIERFFDVKDLKKLTNDTLISFSEYINNLKCGRSNKAKIIAISKHFVKYINDEHRLKLNLKYLYLLKDNFNDHNSFNYLDEESFKKFINVIDNKFFELMFRLYYYYGLRTGELRALKNKDFDLDNYILNIRRNINSKNQYHTSCVTSLKTRSSERSYPLTPTIINLFKCVSKFKDPECFIFTYAKTIKGATIPRYVIGHTTIKRYKDYYLKKANVSYVRLHDFRHSCAIFLTKHDFDINRIAQWLGHSSPRVTAQFYLKYQDNYQKELADCFENVMKLNE